MGWVYRAIENRLGDGERLTLHLNLSTDGDYFFIYRHCIWACSVYIGLVRVTNSWLEMGMLTVGGGTLAWFKKPVDELMMRPATNPCVDASLSILLPLFFGL